VRQCKNTALLSKYVPRGTYRDKSAVFVQAGDGVCLGG
jgi:hypothetical protein